MHDVKIGVYDNIFLRHEDLTYKKIWNEYISTDNDVFVGDMEHGTSVAGVLAANFDNGKGIAGVACKRELYAYAHAVISDEVKEYQTLISVMEYKYSLALMIGNGVRVINCSACIESRIGYAAYQENKYNYNEKPATYFLDLYTEVIEKFLNRLLDREYDFIIVQAAGNDNDDLFVWNDLEDEYHCIGDVDEIEIKLLDENAKIGDVNAKYSSFFAYSNELKERVIVVGSYGKYNNRNSLIVSEFSNVGDRVDVIAPGEQIHSTISNDRYANDLSGTSYATPYVSGTAALVYSVNPELSGIQVKDIIISTAEKELSGLDKRQKEVGGIVYNIAKDPNTYKCLDAGAAVEMALNEKGETPTLGENTGFIMGFIGYKESEESDTEVICDAQISAYRYSVYDGNVEEDYQYTTTSDSDGYYSLCVDPGIYQVTIYKEGYIPLVIENVEVVEGVVTYQEDILTIKEARLKTRFEITGKVVDALNGNAISDANVRFREGQCSYKGVFPTMA